MRDDRLKQKIEETVAKASFVLRKDVMRLIKHASRLETNEKAKKALGWILDNAKIAELKSLAVCQDTGLPVVFIEAGKDIKLSSSAIEAIKKAIESGYRKNCLRSSIVDPLRREKPTYRGLVYHIDFCHNKKGLKIIILPKGFGSENKTRLKMFDPTAGSKDIEDFVVESIKKAGPESCPPFVVGIGIGGTSDHALTLAKKALLKPLGMVNKDKLLNRLEESLLAKINSLKIGPMGLGGKTTCLAVRIMKAPTHIAGLPVGINISCYALRSASLNLKRI